MRQVKMLFSKNLERIIQNEPELAENSDLDNNNIMLILMISYFFKTFKLVIIILTVSYFIGMVWYIYCDLTSHQTPVTKEDCPKFFSQDYCNTVDFENADANPDGKHLEDAFFNKFDLRSKTDEENAIIMTYYAFTTLSTVGFGDYHPRSDAERAVCAFILLVGVAIFSYIMGNFIEILISI